MSFKPVHCARAKNDKNKVRRIPCCCLFFVHKVACFYCPAQIGRCPNILYKSLDQNFLWAWICSFLGRNKTLSALGLTWLFYHEISKASCRHPHLVEAFGNTQRVRCKISHSEWGIRAHLHKNSLYSDLQIGFSFDKKVATNCCTIMLGGVGIFRTLAPPNSPISYIRHFDDELTAS